MAFSLGEGRGYIGGQHPGSIFNTTFYLRHLLKYFIYYVIIRNMSKQRLSAAAAKAKAIRDLAYANSPARKAKRAENQRLRRAAIKAGINIKGKDYDHKDKKFKPASENRAGTKNE